MPRAVCLVRVRARVKVRVKVGAGVRFRVRVRPCAACPRHRRTACTRAHRLPPCSHYTSPSRCPAAHPPRWQAAAPCTRASRRCWSRSRPPSRCSCPSWTPCARHTASRSVNSSEPKRPRAGSHGTSWRSRRPGSRARWLAACPPSSCLIRQVRPAVDRPAARRRACERRTSSPHEVRAVLAQASRTIKLASLVGNQSL